MDFFLSLKWRDPRLMFRNLHEDVLLNKLENDDLVFDKKNKCNNLPYLFKDTAFVGFSCATVAHKLSPVPG